MKKRLLSIILIGLMIFSLSIDGFIYANEDERPEYQPDLIIESVNTPVANAGSNYSFSFKIKNAGDVSANDIVITPVFESGKSPFNLGSNERYTIDKLNPKSSRDVRMTFKVEGNVEEDSYPMTLNFQYRYGGKNGFTKKDSFTQKLNIRVVNENTSPQLFISRATTSHENIQPGQSAKLRIGLANKGTVVAKNVRVTLGGLNSKGFYLAKGSDKTSINRVLGNDEEFVAYDLKASNTMLPGGYELEVKVQYDYAGNLVEDTQKIYLNIGSKSGKNSNVAIENLRFTTTPVKPNNNANISFTVKNKGQLNAKNIIVKVESAEGSGVVPTSQSILKIGGMKPGQSRDLNFRFMPTPGSETRNYPINITVEYVDELNESTQNKYIVTEYAGIYVYNPPKKEVKPKEPGPEHKPKLIIDKYSFSPQIVKAGENFTMNLSFYNTNSKKSVKNIKIFLTSDEKTEEDTGGGGNSVFTPVETSNTFYIENIPPKGRVEKSIKMFTVPDAKAKTYTVVANFEYEDAKAKEYTATELIGVPVVQKSKLDIGQLNIAGEMYQNEGSPLNVEFYNTGKVTLYNLMVRVEGNFQKKVELFL